MTYDGDPLASLGLIDPRSGAAVPTEDWRPDPNARPASGARDDGYDTEGDAGPSSGATDSQDSPAGQGAGQPEASQSWESDANPYKAQVSQLQSQLQQAQQGAQPVDPAQALNATTQQIEHEARLAYQQLTTVGLGDGQPLPPQVAQMIVNSARAAALNDARLAAERIALLPAAKAESARRVAQEFSVGNVKIESSEIESEPTIEAMRARAKTLAETRRDQAVSQRRASGADRVEGTGAMSKVDYDKLTSRDKIRLGISRGQA